MVFAHNFQKKLIGIQKEKSMIKCFKVSFRELMLIKN
jgi:hypothetical protein